MNEIMYESAYNHIKLCIHSSNVQHTIYHEYKIGINNKSEYSHSEVLVDI